VPVKTLILLLCACAVLCLTSGCGGRENLFVLLPDPDGKVGAITVTNPEGSVTLTRASEATGIKGKTAPPEPAFSMEQEEIQEVFGPVLEAEPVPPVHFLLYFLSGSTDLDEASRQELPKIRAAIRDRRSVDISIVGHSDTVGDDEYNVKLSLDRALAVGEILMADGVQKEHLQVTSHGERNLLIETGDGVEESRNRRVEVIVR
jgi:outer membrane protein OmpA-like peptidoglycan-associated protein